MSKIKIIAATLAVIDVFVVSSSIYFFSSGPLSFEGISNKIFPSQVVAASVDGVLIRYCTEEGNPKPIRLSLNITNAHFDDISALIQAAIEDRNIEQLGLIWRELWRMMMAKEGEADKFMLTRDSLRQTANHEQILLDSRHLSNEVLQDRVAVARELFSDFDPVYHPAIKIEVEGVQYYLDNFGGYYNAYYNAVSSDEFKNKPQSEKERDTLAYLGMIAQASLLQDQIVPHLADAREQWLKAVEELKEKDLSLLYEELANGVSEQGAGLLIGLVGAREIFEELNITNGRSLLQCAAETYYDDLAMHELAILLDTERQRQELLEQWQSFLEREEEYAEENVPESIRTEFFKDTIVEIFPPGVSLPSDPAQALFWALATATIDPIRYQVFTNYNYSFGLRNISLLNILINSGIVTDQEKEVIEQRVCLFVEKKYPDLVYCAVTSQYDVSSYTEAVKEYAEKYDK